MKSALLACAAVVVAGLTGPARADVIRSLHLEFQSGAVFSGTVTFKDDFAGILDVAGTLWGGPWGSKDINWSWLAATGGTNPQDLDGDASTYEDWLLDGTDNSDKTVFIGLSWSYPVGGSAPIIAASNDPPQYHAAVKSDWTYSDLIVSGRFSVPEPSTLVLVGLASLAAARRRNK